jgi:TldD protein
VSEIGAHKVDLCNLYLYILNLRLFHISRGRTVNLPDNHFAFIDKHLVQAVLDTALSRGGDFAELFLQHSSMNGASFEEGRVREAESGTRLGAGIRVIQGERTGYAASDDLSKDTLLEAAKTSGRIANEPTAPATVVLPESSTKSPVISPVEQDFNSVPVTKKIHLLESVDQAARDQDSRVIQVIIDYRDTTRNVMICNSKGLWVEDSRQIVRMMVRVIVEANGRRETGKCGGGGQMGFEYFHHHDPAEFGRRAVQQAVTMLDAREAPAGPQMVVMANGWAGVLLHEAVGHGLEADAARKGSTIYAGKINQKVASELCTVVDDGSLPGKRGSVSIDDEGTRTQRTVLIENGVLKTFMTDRLNGGLMNLPLTGNGRRESYLHPPLPRMTNTFLEAGDSDPEEILKSVKKGFYAVEFGGGQVDTASGQFVFNVTEGYLIENGKPTAPVKGATLIGNGPDVLTKVERVGSDWTLDPGVGTCGKAGQGVPAGVGQPHVLIREMTVGGTSIPAPEMV